MEILDYFCATECLLYKAVFAVHKLAAMPPRRRLHLSGDRKTKPTDNDYRDHLAIDLAVTRFSLNDFSVSQRSPAA